MILENLSQDSLKARKEKDTEKASLLATVISEAKLVGKNAGNRDPTDNEVSDILKKFLKGINETLEILTKNGKDTTATLKEKEILEFYLPKQLSETELAQIIQDIITLLPEKSPKMMGQVMASLKERYPNQYDGKLASQIAKDQLG